MYKSSTNLKDRDLAISEDMFHLVFSTILVDFIRITPTSAGKHIRQIRQEINRDVNANLIIQTIKERVSDYDYVPFEPSIDKTCLVRIF